MACLVGNLIFRQKRWVSISFAFLLRRMLDPDHRCRIERLEKALDQLGLGVELRVRRAGKRLAGTNRP
jgi:hypothetical protein